MNRRVLSSPLRDERVCIQMTTSMQEKTVARPESATTFYSFRHLDYGPRRNAGTLNKFKPTALQLESTVPSRRWASNIESSIVVPMFASQFGEDRVSVPFIC